MNDKLALVTDAKNTEAKDRTDGLMYNALYMFEWQIKRVQSGTWDAFSASLLERGLATARQIDKRGDTYGRRFTKLTIEQLIVEGERLLANVSKEAA